MKSEIRTTHSCLRFLLLFAQCVGLLPVMGITQDSTDLKFKWTSKRTLYSLVFALVATANTIFFVMKMFREEIQTFSDWVTLVFYLVTVITIGIFIDIARKWPNLLKKWTRVDNAMLNYGYPKGLHKKLKIISSLILGAAIVEHSLFIVVQLALGRRGRPLMETIDNFFEFRFDHVFAVVGYHPLLGIFLQVLNIFSTVSWNFMDLFIIVISLCLSERFKQVAKNIEYLSTKQIIDEKLWERARQDYYLLSVLCESIDSVLSTLVVVSFGNNLFVILVQLYNTLKIPPLDGWLDKIYYIYSFAFLIIRIITVALYASTVNTESKKPRFYLNTSSTFIYNVEIERLIFQTKYDPPTLTGHKLFKVTRPFILRVAVAIVSYELVLVELLKFNT